MIRVIDDWENKNWQSGDWWEREKNIWSDLREVARARPGLVVGRRLVTSGGVSWSGGRPAPLWI